MTITKEARAELRAILDDPQAGLGWCPSGSIEVSPSYYRAAGDMIRALDDLDAAEATIARLTAAPTDDEIEAAKAKVWKIFPAMAAWWESLPAAHNRGNEGIESMPPEPFECALTAFIEGRKGDDHGR